MSAENLKLWESLYTTDPKHTKGFQRAGGFSGTAIKPMWAIYRATKEFGPVGKGWGWTEHQHVIESGMVFTQVSVWYMQAGQRCETGPQWGGTPIATKRKDGTLFTDDESFKKSTTDGITKCLSYLGIGADVHMGQFDDSKYVAEAAKTTAESEKADGAEKARLWVGAKIAEMETLSSIEALKTLHTTADARLIDIRAKHPKEFDRYSEALATHKKRLAPAAAAE